MEDMQVVQALETAVSTDAPRTKRAAQTLVGQLAQCQGHLEEYGGLDACTQAEEWVNELDELVAEMAGAGERLVAAAADERADAHGEWTAAIADVKEHLVGVMVPMR